MKFLLILAFILTLPYTSNAQKYDSEILETVLQHHYKNEKPVYKNRSQLTYFYCDKPNNNEELFETVRKLKLTAKESQSIRKQVETNTTSATWQQDLDNIFSKNMSQLSIKVNKCLSLEEYNETRNPRVNNQRLMIVSKPVFYQNQTHALVKVVFYRSIEHNSGSVVHLHKVANKWVIKEFLSEWAT